MVDDKVFYWTFSRFQLESEFLLNRREEKIVVVTSSVVELEIETSAEAGLIGDRVMYEASQFRGQKRHRDVLAGNVIGDVR